MADLKGKAGLVRPYPPGRTPALIFIGVFILSTWMPLVSFWFVPDVCGNLREAAAETFGEISHPDTAPLSGEVFTDYSGWEVTGSNGAVRRAGLLAEQSRDERKDGAEKSGMPESPHPDLGQMSLSQVCARYSLDLAEVLKTLADNEIKASADMSLSRIAEENDLSPLDVYELIREVAERDSPVTPGSDESK